MPNLVIAAVQFGGYISVVKFVIFLVLFFAWLALIGWVHNDAESIGTRSSLWTAILLVAGLLGIFLWLVIPIFIVGLVVYIITVGASAISYVMHRNARVPEFDRVLTLAHIKGLLTNPEKKLEKLQDIGFITANGNEVPIPELRTPEFFGFKAAYDLFSNAIYYRASDISIAPASEGYNLTYTVDGVTLQQPSLSADNVEHLCRFLKHLADLDVEERRKPQKGTFSVRQEKGISQWEVEVAGSTAGEQIKLHQVAQENVFKLSELGLFPDQYQQLNAIRDLKQGIFLVSGPKQSGVTTTFYALIRNHDAFLNNIVTLEYRPTGQLPNVTQEVFSLSDSGTTTYAKKLLYIVRMSPDVLGAVDVKDKETAKVICQAAREGAIVYATMEADTVAAAIAKWISLVGDKALALRYLIGASNQRLYRKLCNECKQAYEPNRDLLRKFNIPAEKAKVLYRVGKVVYDKRGKAYPCENCHEIGFYGRACVFEIVMFDDRLRKAVAQAKSTQEIALRLRQAKVKYLQEQMLERVLDGTTSINEMIRVFSGQKKTRQRAAGQG